MKTILIPTDFSENSTRAIEYAVTLFGQSESRFVFAHVIPSLEYPPELLGRITNGLRKDITASVSSQVTSVKNTHEIEELDYEIVVELGEPSVVIKNLTDSVKADIIVMGTQGIGKREQVTTGTTAVKTIQEVACPVIVVPEVTIVKIPQAIVFASDRETINDSAVLEPLKALAVRFDSHVSVLHIITDDVPHTENIKALKENLNTILTGVSHSYNFSKFEHIVYGLVEAIHDQDVDLLAMISKHHGEMESLLEDSSTAAMAIYSDIPLLVLPDTIVADNAKDDMEIHETVD